MSEIAENRAEPGQTAKETASGKSPWRFAPLAVIVLCFLAVFVFDLDRFLSFEVLRENRQWLIDTVAEHHLLSALVFILIYAAVAVSVPGASLLTLIGGFLFGAVVGTVYVVLAATLGAVGIFLAARTALSDILRAKAGPWLSKLQSGFHENELSYLLFLRLVPAFPFFIVNIVPAFLGVSLRTYTLATLIGIIPGTAVYAVFGAGLGEILASDAELSLTGILSPELVIGMVGLAVLALVPVLVRRFSKKSAGG